MSIFQGVDAMLHVSRMSWCALILMCAGCSASFDCQDELSQVLASPMGDLKAVTVKCGCGTGGGRYVLTYITEPTGPERCDISRDEWLVNVSVDGDQDMPARWQDAHTLSVDFLGRKSTTCVNGPNCPTKLVGPLPGHALPQSGETVILINP